MSATGTLKNDGWSTGWTINTNHKKTTFAYNDWAKRSKNHRVVRKCLFIRISFYNDWIWRDDISNSWQDIYLYIFKKKHEHTKRLRVVNGGKRVSSRCMAAMLTFLRGTSADATRNSAPLRRYFVTTPTQGPVLTSETKCRTCWSHMTPLYSQNRLMHKYAGKKDPIYPTTMHRIPLLPKQPHHCAYTAGTKQIRRVSVGKNGGHFVKACAEKKRDASDRLKIKNRAKPRISTNSDHENIPIPPLSPSQSASAAQPG